ncbi:hypothetical protein ALO66_200067 [Pseudomonas coronafaciens pv. atropurpurea]|nr:hypothetical protein ALO66_200067 [Pseudomonas coronafaciens pv. atropurpurea]
MARCPATSLVVVATQVLYTPGKGKCKPEAMVSRVTANLKEARGKMLA